MDKVNIMRQKWDYLIILDACRYDYFERMHGKYIQGQLTKKISPGSCTDEWRDKSFPDHYDDVVYISANPQFSASSKVYGYCAGEHFHRVYEVWKDGWVKGTVLPETLTAAAIKIIKSADVRGKRVIIHYLQPHAPYISLADDARGYVNADVNTPRTLVGVESAETVSWVKKKLFRCLLKLFEWNNLLGNHPDWQLRKFLHIPPKAPMEIILRSYSISELRQAYEANLELVLSQLAVLMKHLSGRIVVTSDHGDLLGENKSYSHPCGSSDPILRQVPWLVVDKQSEDVEQTDFAVEDKEAEKIMEHRNASDADEQAELAGKLRALGYYD